MARIRTIKPEYWESEKLGRLSVDARLNFLGLVSLADDEGRGRGALDWLGGRLHPYSPKSRGRLLESSMRELRDAGVVFFYTVDGCKYYSVKNFGEHQRIDKPTPSKIPPRELAEDSENPLGDLAYSSMGERNGMDQGREGKGEEAILGGLHESKRAPGRFAPPSLPDIEGYWTERGLKGEPEAFMDYFASKGWRVGNAPMRDWKAAARNWSRNENRRRTAIGNALRPAGAHHEQYLELERQSEKKK